MTAHESGEDKFIADVADRTVALIREHQPGCVALCAPPRALGQLRKLLAYPLSGLSMVSIDKDITKESVGAIDARVRELHA
jgi:protein required for attachment to host cells